MGSPRLAKAAQSLAIALWRTPCSGLKRSERPSFSGQCGAGARARGAHAAAAGEAAGRSRRAGELDAGDLARRVGADRLEALEGASHEEEELERKPFKEELKELKSKPGKEELE